MTFKERLTYLENVIETSYEDGVTLEHAEKLAAEFLHAQMLVSSELRKADLNARMRKSGLKAVRAAVYTDACSNADKKPTESALEHLINMNELVSGEQDGLDNSEVERDELTRLYNIFINSHIHFRAIARGNFGS